MQVKRYEVSSINEAMTKIKEDMGPDAIILSTKKIINGAGESALEVIAARDEKVVPPMKHAVEVLSSESTSLTEGRDDFYKFIREEIGEVKEILRAAQREKSVREELEELKETMDKFFDLLGARKRRSNPDVNRRVYYQLLSCGFSRASACSIMEELCAQISSQEQLTEDDVLQIVRQFVIKSMPANNTSGEEKRIKAYVGATGVGKTTTLAKLAARYSLMKKMNVGLITLDTFRIAAIEQLRTYAKIMGIRMEVASTKETFQKSLQLLSDKDIVLIDTPGRSCVDEGYLGLMDNMLQNGDIETNLLISSTASEDNLMDMVAKYSPFDYDNLIITKTDESRRFGILYDVINKARKPVSFLTCGQNVPQDIEEVTPHKMANLIMKRVVH
ncbi:MAG: flagellar biosynthesis protein FlhF [Smithellaceae bacterium]